MRDRPSGQKRKRRQRNHDERDGNRQGKHEAERAEDHDDARQQLRQPLQHTVADLVDVIDHARQEVPVGVGVDEGQR